MWSILLNLLPTGGVSRLWIGACVCAAVAAGGGYIGWRVGDARADRLAAQYNEERAQIMAETADALALLAARAADAEAKFAAERAKKRRVVERRVEVVKHEIQQLPARDCPVRDDARGLLVRALCAHDRYAAHAECVPAPVPGTPDATDTGPARDGNVPVGG